MVVKNLDRGPEYADGLGIRAVGEIETAQTIVGCRESQPGFCVTRMLFDRQAEVLLSKAKIVGAILLLAKAQFVIRIAAEEAGRGGRRRTSAR